MKVYEVISLSERNPSASDVADLADNLVVDKQVFPDGRIRVLLPDGEIIDFRDADELETAKRGAKDRMARKVGGFRSLRRLALSRMVWWPAMAIQIFESVEAAITELTSPTGDPQRAINEALEAATTVIAAGIVGAARTAAAGANGIKWIKRLTTAKRSAQMATAALGAAGFATGGTTWIGALITGAGWIVTEIALYFATEYFVDMIVDEFFDTEELEEEVARELRDEITLLLGLTRDARHVDADGDGQPDNVDDETGQTIDPETGEPYKYNVGDLTQQDIERLLNPNLTPQQRAELANNPEYRDFYQRWRQEQGNNSTPGSGGTRRITDFERESIEESPREEKVAGAEELRGFIKFLSDKGYDEELQRNVVRVARQKIRNN